MADWENLQVSVDERNPSCGTTTNEPAALINMAAVLEAELHLPDISWKSAQLSIRSVRSVFLCWRSGLIRALQLQHTLNTH